MAAMGTRPSSPPADCPSGQDAHSPPRPARTALPEAQSAPVAPIRDRHLRRPRPPTPPRRDQPDRERADEDGATAIPHTPRPHMHHHGTCTYRTPPGSSPACSSTPPPRAIALTPCKHHLTQTIEESPPARIAGPTNVGTSCPHRRFLIGCCCFVSTATRAEALAAHPARCTKEKSRSGNSIQDCAGCVPAEKLRRGYPRR